MIGFQVVEVCLGFVPSGKSGYLNGKPSGKLLKKFTCRSKYKSNHLKICFAWNKEEVLKHYLFYLLTLFF
jgi:hypothetical protein